MNELRPAALRQTINHRPPRILVVEDDTALATMVVYNLQSEGFIAEYLDRGDEVELRLSNAAPDLVILDWKLPGVSGLEICRRLRARDDIRDMPVIMLTARGEESERMRGLVAWRRVGTEFALWLRDYARRMNCA